MRSILLLASCALICLAAGACGSDDEAAPAGSPTDDAGTGPQPPGGRPRLVDKSDMLPPSSESTTDVLLADLDGDGDSDILWVSQPYPPTGEVTKQGSLEITINAFGRFEAGNIGVSLESLQGAYQFARAADVDKDGDLDLVLTRGAITRPEVALLLNDGKGKFTQATFPPVIGEIDGLVLNRVAIADVDKDGDLDIFVPIFANVARDVDLPSILFMNDGKGVFTRDQSGRLPSIPPQEDYTLGASFGDVNGDGAPDLFLGETERQQRILINDGTGKFIDQTADDGTGKRRLEEIKVRAYRSDMLDLDGDSDLDIVVVSDTTSPTQPPVEATAFFNDGSGHFASKKMPGVAGNTYALGFGKLNDDDLTDVVVGRANSQTPHNGKAVEFLLGTGGGSFVDMGVEGLGPWQVGVYGVAVGDLNGDGIGDVAVAVGEPDPAGSMRNLLFLSEGPKP